MKFILLVRTILVRTIFMVIFLLKYLILSPNQYHILIFNFIFVILQGAQFHTTRNVKIRKRCSNKLFCANTFQIKLR